MGLVLLALAAIAIFALRGLYLVARGRVRSHGIHRLVWRWLTGQPWHGKPVTDAGWLRPGTRPLTVTGHASRFHHRIRWHRTAMRTGSTLAVLALAWLWLADPLAAVLLLSAVLLLGLVLGALLAWRGWHQRKHRRTWIEPLHVVCAPLVGHPVAVAPRAWLRIEPDRSHAVLSLVAGRDYSDPAEQSRIVRAAAAKLAIEAPGASWRLGGPEPTLTITRSQPPPPRVLLADVLRYFDELGPEVLVIGLGKGGKPVTISLDGDSPHLGLTMGSGGGKSVTARLLAAQMLYKGAIVLNLDIKWISHTWAAGLPNVAYAREIHEIHQALVWLAGEVDRRNRVAAVAADVEGRVHANVGPRIFVVCEELNATMKKLRAYWRKVRESGDPVRSPALDALDEVNFTGRQVRVNLLMIGQRLSAEATGGGDARESLAALIFSRYKPSTWKMLVPDMPMPPATRHAGRAEVVTDSVRQTQVAYLTGAQARELAVAGRVSVCPAGMPSAGAPLPAAQKQGELPDRADVGNGTVSGPPERPAVSAPEPVTLSAAVAAGILPMKLAAARTARHRDEQFPRPVAQSGLANLYDPVELGDWFAARSSS
jgi:hypothetical protein